MKQDRRLNGWILISSILKILASVIFLGAGIALGVLGFFFKNKLVKIEEIQYIVHHDWIIKAQKFITNSDKLLKDEFLYLFLGIALAVIGVILLVLGIMSLVYANKRKVVRRRVPLIIFSLFDLTIAGATAFTYYKEYDRLSDFIKSLLPNAIEYTLFGITGLFAFIALCIWLGLIFGRSEKFMSNDNNKFAHMNPKRNVTMANGNVAGGMIAQRASQPAEYRTQAQEAQQAQSAGHRVLSPEEAKQRMAQPQQRPVVAPPRPQTAPRPQAPNMSRPPMQGQPIRPQGVARPAGSSGNMARPMPQGAPKTQAPKHCKKCGKLLNPGERFCSLCGSKVE